ncbi:proline racemase family protein [Agromyces sp. LHK192]|uniref:proline racemase family protein n=1 Tax=Agromyces sp. LHK192 TaxID=2498704 RepID=UPI000FD7B8CB|nr:proline racemase family protein [Agromyces sp. LHK192]
MPNARETYETVDYHTGGEPFRIVPDPPFAIPGDRVAERRVAAMGSPEIERVRRLLCFEPRGHADMYGGFIVAPDDDGAHLGVLFWHKDGFSTACGHGTIALGTWAVETGLVPADASGVTDVLIDVPSGRVTARVHTDADGAVVAVDFRNVASYLIAERVPVATSRGEVIVDLAFGGAIYAQLDAASVGLTVSPEHAAEIIAIGREVKWALNDSELARHPIDDRLSGVYGTIVFEDLGADASGALHQRNATVFADGELDRSPCGSGTCARVATLSATGRLAAGATLVHDSIVGSRFLASTVGTTEVAGRPAVLPQVTGTAFATGTHRFTVDPRDTLVPGFVLR